MPFTEPLAQFFDPGDFGTTATWSGQSVNGNFDAEYSAFLGAEGTTPAFTCQASAVDGIAYGDTITIDGSNYTVREVQGDGLGVVTLILEGP